MYYHKETDSRPSKIIVVSGTFSIVTYVGHSIVGTHVEECSSI